MPPVTPSTDPQVLETTSPPEKTDLKEIKQNVIPTLPLTDVGTDSPAEDIGYGHGLEGLSLSQNTWGKLLNPENPTVDGHAQIPIRDAEYLTDTGKFSETNYFRGNDGVSRERTSRGIAIIYAVLPANSITRLVRGTDLMLRVFLRNMTTGQTLYVGIDGNVSSTHCISVLDGFQTANGMDHDTIEGSTDIYVQVGGTAITIIGRIEYARL